MAWYNRFLTAEELRRLSERTRGADPHAVRIRIEEGFRRAEQARQAPTVLRASGRRITRMPAEQMRMAAGNRQPWQQLAWGYRDMIGELRGALRFRSNAISNVKFYVAEVSDDDADPIPVSLRHDTDDQGNRTEKADRVTLSPQLCAAAEAELKRLPLDAGYSFLGVWSENFDVAGECWLHGRTDPLTGREVWEIRSVDDVDVQGRTVTLKNELGQPRPVDLPDAENDYAGSEEMYRLWVPHPRSPWLADSTLNATMDTLEDITLAGRELRAVARSRIAANGILLVPLGMSELRNVRLDDENAQDNQGSFMANLQAAMLAPISNEGDPGGVVPLVLTGSREDIEAFRFVRVDREDSPTLLSKLDKALGRMGNSLDIPPEIITGMADVNHWTAWQIDAATFRHYLEPAIRVMVDSLTGAFLRAALTAQGFQPDEIARVRIWYDAGQITENPNRRQDALDARDHLAISDDAFRDALGFDDGDAPTAQEQLMMVAAKAGMDQAGAAAVLRWAVEQQPGADPPPLPAAAPATQLPAARTPAAPDATGVGGTGAPDSDSPAAVAASGGRPRPLPNRMGVDPQPLADLVAGLDPAPPPEPRYTLDTETGRRLMALDRALRDTLLLAADAALTRALERAGSRLRAKATKNGDLSAQLRQFDLMEWPMRCGRDQALALGADARFLLNQAWDSFRATFEQRTDTTIDEIVTTVADKLLRYTGQRQRDAIRRMKADMAARIEGAWSRLLGHLERYAERVMFDGKTGDESDLGEQPALVVPPYLIRNALAEIGGLPETAGAFLDDGRLATGEPVPALSTGATVTRELNAAGVLDLGYTWVYGVTEMRRQLHPHRALEGQRFTNWHDQVLRPPVGYEWLGEWMRPGDHRGCMCDAVVGYALPDYADQVRDALRVPSAPSQDVLNLAAEDDRAGRTGTTAQAFRDQHAEIQALQARFMKGA